MRTTNLLTNFIKDRMHAYREPTREGTARGEAVGFSRDKYHAALLSALTALSQKSIADKLGISYGVVRKWHVESEFKDAMASNLSKFNMFFWTRIRENANEMQQIVDKNLGDDEAPEMSQYHFESDYEYGISACRTLCRGAENIKHQIQGDTSSVNLVYALEAWRALSALMDSQLKEYSRKLGRPKSEPTTTESGFENRNQFARGADSRDAEARVLFERVIRFLENTILNRVPSLLESDEIRGSNSRRIGMHLLKAIVQERNRREVTETKARKSGSRKSGRREKTTKKTIDFL
jgi:hypothetical protein